jgi:hypothetical protein
VVSAGWTNGMRHHEWQATAPNEIKGDSLWKHEVYRLGLFAADIAWQDAVALGRQPLARDLADQLYRAVCSISANIAEDYLSSTGKDRARLLEYSMNRFQCCNPLTTHYSPCRQDHYVITKP